ncbi:hypothetical protein A2765_04625 [Candidatus Kaiserbacteria bacterium RIFCSPHIGHO2_01_FULL_56_24]|uniref:Uncharacterized protein n=1 Tax=Candidatus Kaiserbacteria bacterium RIFCSPHIGHO2_01_FULL_56_24 TaxID=1798487 RepID=A0A1F6DFQ1_9BACT|nr:MAG: hypothetical protein A2765_04625 [Candidatus Kaiserbacteria bacterium RIFCSPHIGHO2_01_FULL_56_24]
MRETRDVLHKFAVVTTRRGRRKIVIRLLHQLHELHTAGKRKRRLRPLPVSTGPRPLINCPAKTVHRPKTLWSVVTTGFKKFFAMMLPAEPLRFADS